MEFNIQKDINWDLFNKEEKEAIINCFQHDEWYNLTSLPGVVINNPDKEKEIEKIVFEMRGVDVDNESEVRDDLEKLWASGEKINTPEEEAEWQKKIDNEKVEKEKLMKDVKKEPEDNKELNNNK